VPQRFIAGVDIGASNVRVAISNEDGDIETRRAMPFPGGSPEDVLAKVRRTIDDLIRGVWVGAAVAATGVVLPGTVDPERGLVASPANMPGWGEVDVAAALGARKRVAVENDANAAAVGEIWRGAARGMTDVVFVALGTGIGAGAVIDGRLHRGAHFLAGEVAFFPMTPEQLRNPDWEDCLEGLVGGRAAAAHAPRIAGEGADAARLFARASAGDPAAAEWLQRTQEYLAMAVAQMCALLDPQAVVFGGGVAAAQGEEFIAPVREMALRCLPAKPQVLVSSLGEDAQVVGAVRLALDRLEAVNA
jgi:glucokinase